MVAAFQRMRVSLRSRSTPLVISPAHQAGIYIHIGECDGTELFEIEVQHLAKDGAEQLQSLSWAAQAYLAVDRVEIRTNDCDFTRGISGTQTFVVASRSFDPYSFGR